MWVVLAAIVMMFAALSVGYIYLMSSEEKRQLIAMPRMFVVSTGLILVSSWAFEKAKTIFAARERSHIHQVVAGNAGAGLRFHILAACWLAGTIASRRLLLGQSAEYLFLSGNSASRGSPGWWYWFDVLSRHQRSTACIAVEQGNEFDLDGNRRSLLAHNGRNLALAFSAAAGFQVVEKFGSVPPAVAGGSYSDTNPPATAGGTDPTFKAE